MRFLTVLCAYAVYVNAKSPSDIPDIFTSEKAAYKDVRCQVCKSVVVEMNKLVWDVSPTLKLDIGGYRLDAYGNKVQKEVQYKRSEMHMMDVMEEVCKKLENHVRGKLKKTGKTVVFPLISDGKMNTLMNYVDLIQDDDMNRSIQFYCEGIVEEYEDEIMAVYGKYEDQIMKRVCIEATGLCPEGEEEDEDYLMDLEESTEEFDEPMRRVADPEQARRELYGRDMTEEKDEL